MRDKFHVMREPTRAVLTAGRNLTQQEWQQAFGNEPYRKTCPI